jgi:hypothetical protein
LWDLRERRGDAVARFSTGKPKIYYAQVSEPLSYFYSTALVTNRHSQYLDDTLAQLLTIAIEIPYSRETVDFLNPPLTALAFDSNTQSLVAGTELVSHQASVAIW